MPNLPADRLMTFNIKVPQDRVAVIIGHNGRTIRMLAERSGTRIEVDSESGDIILHDETSKDPYMAFVMRDVIRAIGRGFPPEKAVKLFQDEIYYEEFDIRHFSGKSSKRVMQVRSRMIGSGGKTRKLIEELTDCSISIKGNTVGIIGDIEGMKVASKAINMILSGSEHSSVYSYMEHKRRDLKVARWGF